MDETWSALARYKLLEERIEELKAEAVAWIVPSDDIQESLAEAEAELVQLKVWIASNYPTHRAD